MRAWKAIVVLAGIGAAVRYAPEFVGQRRGVMMEPPVPVERSQSAALFVGVRKFDHAVEVPYAVDDAVDLAYLFALDARVSVIPPTHVVLALSGTPQKPRSREKLAELRRRGAKVEDADFTTILNLLNQQADLAGKDGLLVVSIATHGFAEDGIAKILGKSSRFEYPETAVSLPRVFDIASRSARSLLFIDACRERITAARSAAPQEVTKAPLLEKMLRYNGQVVFYAAPAGGWSYDDENAKNGVFTKAVLDGMQCNASAKRKLVSVETLRTYVERQVLNWIREHRDPSIETATQISFDGNSGRMPLAQCPPPPTLIDVTKKGSMVTAIDERGRKLWAVDFIEPVKDAVAADLDADGILEVITTTSKTLVVLDSRRHQLWRASAAMPLAGITIGDRAKGTVLQQIVALWSDGRTSRLVSYDATGQILESTDRPDALQLLAIYRPTKTYSPRVVVAGVSGVVLFDKGEEIWRHPLPSSPIRLEMTDCDNDRKKDILITLAKGRTQCFSVKGDLLTH